jgi:hypothetical protein
MRAKIKAGVEEMKTECIKATHMLITLQGWASDVLHRVPKGAMYEETVRATEDRFGD